MIAFSEEGIQVKNDNGNWYGFVCSMSTIIRLDFGASLWNTPTAVNIIPSPVFVMAHGMVITKEGDTWLGFVGCSLDQKLFRLNFGTSLANIPGITDFGNVGGVLTGPGAICLVQENSNWSALLLAGSNTLARLDFGPSLLNAPTGVNLGNPGGFNLSLGLTLLRDCETTTGYWVNYLVPGQLGKLTFPAGIYGPVTGTVLGDIGNLLRPHSFSEIFRQNDTLFAYISNRDNGTLTRLTFPPCTSASIPSSSLFNPPLFSYDQPGTYNIHLIVDEGLSSMVSMCKQVTVMDPQIVTLGNDRSICPGDSTVLDAGAGFTGYLWSTGAMTRMITVHAAGTYSVTGTRWGCSTSDTVVVSLFPTPQVNLGPDTTVCQGQTHTFDAGPCTGCTYQWDNLTTGQMNIGSGQTYTTGQAGQYMATIQDGHGCLSKDTATLSVIPGDTVRVTVSASANPVCEGALVTFTAAAINGGSTPHYQWIVNGNPFGPDLSSIIYSPSSGDSIRCILTSNEICVTNNPASSIQHQMVVLTTPSVTFTACFDTITTTNAKPFKLKGGIPLGGTYSGTGVINGIHYPSVAGTGNHQINYSYTNAALCAATAHSTIHQVNNSTIACGSTLTDIRDNKTYPTVVIGSQCWFTTDLNYGNVISPGQHQRDNCIPERYKNPASGIPHPASFYQWDELMQYAETEGQQGLCPPDGMCHLKVTGIFSLPTLGTMPLQAPR